MTDAATMGAGAEKSATLLESAARECVSVFDTGFFRALCEPSRIAVLQALILLGRADVGTIAERLPQDRSVVARHLQQLAGAGIVKSDRAGRHVIYQLDVEAVAERLETILATTRLLEKAMKQALVEPAPPQAPAGGSG